MQNCVMITFLESMWKQNKISSELEFAMNKRLAKWTIGGGYT